MIEMSAIPLGVFWAVFGGSVLLLDATLLFISVRYWQRCIAISMLMTLLAFATRTPAITSQKDSVVIFTIVVLSGTVGLLGGLRSLRNIMREEPNRSLNKMIGPDLAPRFMITVLIAAFALFAAALLLLKGLAP